MLATVPASAGFGIAELHIDIDDVEHMRRQAAGLGVATGYGFGGLDVLMALPHGLRRASCVRAGCWWPRCGRRAPVRSLWTRHRGSRGSARAG